MNGYGIKLDQEYTPVRLGKWSKVICEFRHRYCQDAENTYQNTCVPDSAIKFIDSEQTRPKASTEEQNYARVAKKLDECLQTKSSPYMSPDKERAAALNDSGIHSPSSSPLDLSANLVDIYPEGDGPKKPCSKIYVDLKTRRFTCEACGSSFDSLEDAELHLVGSDEPLLCNDDACVPRDSDDVPHDTDKCHDGQEPGNESEGASSDHPPANNHGQLQEYATLDVKDVANCNGSKLGKETELHVPKDALDSTFARSKRKKRRRKKKNKPWRLMKRTFLLALGVLF